MAGNEEEDKQSDPGNPIAVKPTPTAVNPAVGSPLTPVPVVSPGIPPIQGGIPSPMALQFAIGMGQQQNPEVTKHMTEFLAHDSDNRLAAMESSGKRNHTFRMSGMYIGAGLTA
jgi:hypothetical protein